MTFARIVSAVIALLFGQGSAWAGQTDWLSERALQRHVMANMNGGKAYGTAIECRGTTRRNTQLRMTHTPIRGQPPFHRWQWVLAKTTELDQAIARLRLRDRPDLEYRVVQSDRFRLASGESMTCAILYR